MRFGRRGLAAAVVVLALGACGQKGGPSGAPGESAAPADDVVTSTTVPAADGGAASPNVKPHAGTTATTARSGMKAPAAASKGSTPTTTATTVAPADIDGVRLTVPRCAVLGKTLHISIDGPPRALAAMMFMYSDGDSRDASTTGEADQNGHLEADLPITLTAPTGPGRLFVAVNSETGGGTVERQVEIVRDEAACR